MPSSTSAMGSQVGPRHPVTDEPRIIEVAARHALYNANISVSVWEVGESYESVTGQGLRGSQIDAKALAKLETSLFGSALRGPLDP
jgi:hypothetical protein